MSDSVPILLVSCGAPMRHVGIAKAYSAMHEDGVAVLTHLEGRREDGRLLLFCLAHLTREGSVPTEFLCVARIKPLVTPACDRTHAAALRTKPFVRDLHLGEEVLGSRHRGCVGYRFSGVSGRLAHRSGEFKPRARSMLWGVVSAFVTRFCGNS